MRVDVEETGRHDVAVGFEDAPAVEPFADLGDRAAADGDVGPVSGRSRPVDNGSAADDEVSVHGYSCQISARGCTGPRFARV